MVDGEMIGNVEHKPQLFKSKPFTFKNEDTKGKLIVATVDTAGHRAEAVPS